MRSLRTSLRVSLAALAFFGSAAPRPVLAGGDTPPPPAAKPGGDPASDPSDPLTSLEAGPLARSDTVVLGTTHVVRRGVGGAPTLVRIDVTKTFKSSGGGASVGESILVFVAGERPTTQASAPSESFLPLDRVGTCVVFLRKSPAGSGYSLETAFDVEDELGREKAKVLEKEIAISSIKNPAERRQKTLSHLLDLLAGEQLWSMMHAARELNAVSIAAPEEFSDTVLEEIEAVKARATTSRLKGLLADVIERVAPGHEGKARSAAGGTPSTTSPETGAAQSGAAEPGLSPAQVAELATIRRRWREASGDDARLEALTALSKAGKGAAVPDLLEAFRDPSAPIRERAAVLLGDVRTKAALAPLVEACQAEKDPAVREAIVRAAGLLGNEATVPWLVARVEEPGLLRAVLFALARIRTPAALDALAKQRERLLSLEPPDRGIARLIDYLRSKGFVEAERVAGREIGPKPEAEHSGGR